MHRGKILLFASLLISCSQEYRIGEKNKQNPATQADSAYIIDTSAPIPKDTADTGGVEEDLYPMIEITPYDYDFGDVHLNCSEEYELTISSTGTSPLVIDELIYINTPDLSMSYDLFEDIGRLYIYSNARGKSEQKVSHYGQGVIAGSQIDVFEHEQINKADILFVVDNSCSMSQEQVDLSDNAEEFVDKLIGNGCSKGGHGWLCL